MAVEGLAHHHAPVTTVDELWYRVEAAWSSVPVHAIQCLFDSMTRRQFESIFKDGIRPARESDTGCKVASVWTHSGKPFYYWSKSSFTRCTLKPAAGMRTALVTLLLAKSRKNKPPFLWCPRLMLSAPQYPFVSAGCSQRDSPDWTPGVKASLCKTSVDCFLENSASRHSSKLRNRCPPTVCQKSIGTH
ncbi:hypothetical protein TNCV_518511 [Trichonephila clavipes]|nr:hypothetical protein TNCV_518511 [Trichonephila clavipes]